MTECIEPQLYFSFYGNRPLVARFDGGQISSDAGLLLVRQFDTRQDLLRGWSVVLADARDPQRTRHSVEALVTQRVYQIVGGYEDANDAGVLRHDPIFRVLVDAPQEQRLGSQPTLSRLENAVTARDLARLTRALREGFLLCRSPIEAAGEIVLDIDSTADPTYGQQEFSFYNGFYRRSVYHPLLVFERHTGYLLGAHLRRGEVGSSRGVIAVLRRVVRFLQTHFPGVPIRVVGDSGFAIPALYQFCEQRGLEYTIGFASSVSMARRGKILLEKAERRWQRRQSRQVLYSSFRHRGKRWRQKRRICIKAEHSGGRSDVRYVVTNRRGKPEDVFAFYQGRGECENRIEELKNGFSADRLSCHRFLANAFRLLLHSAAYNLVVLFRHRLPEPLRHAQIETLRTRLFKLGALVRRSVRRVWIHLASGWPHQALFSAAALSLSSA